MEGNGKIIIYQSIFNNYRFPMLIIDTNSSRIVDANPAACEYYKYSREDILKLSITDINISKVHVIFEEMKKVENEGKKYFKFKHRLSYGEIREVEIYCGPIKTDEKQLIFSIIHDVQEKKEFEKNAKIQESYFRYLFENSPEAIAMLDNDFNIIKINESFQKVFQYSFEEVQNQNITNIICDEKFYDESTYILDCITSGEFVRRQTQRKRKDGKLIDVSILAYPIIFNQEQIGIYCIYSDLSKVKEEEDKRKLFSEIFKNNTVGVVVTDMRGNIQWINNVFTEVTGYNSKEIMNKKTNILKSGKHDNEFYSNMWNSILNTGRWQGEICNKRKNGELYQEWLNIIAIRDEQGNIEHFVGMLNDITDARQKDIKIEILTNKDNLTNMFNRDYFMNKMNYEIVRRNENIEDYENFAILFLDIDDFKYINDNLGHLIGDNLLKEFALRIKNSIRENDIAARFGGDEFIILLLQIKDQYDVINIAERIIEEICKPYIVDDQELHITASIGIAKYPDDGTDSTALIRNADIAMYKSKESKGNKITLFEPCLDKSVQEYFKIKNSLRNAMNNNEMFLEYQPVVDAKLKQIIGVEALLRWKYKGTELIYPSTFIPIAEKSGMIYQIGEWVLKTACEQNMKWRMSGYKPIVMSVNVSIMQLEHPDFYDMVKKVINIYKVDPRFLQLEITETIFTKNYEKVSHVIKKLNQLGVKIAIDDFGTGYSSLGQLSNMNISILKIDRSFINGVNENLNKSKIVKAIISMAESLNMKLIAEGVETVEQYNFLIENRCSIIQGFIFGRPADPGYIENIFLKTTAG